MESIEVGIRKAKANLSRLLKEVRGGTEIIITERGTPVGRIVPVSVGALPVAERVKEFERRGLIEPPGPKLQGGALLPLRIPGELAQRILQEDREG